MAKKVYVITGPIGSGKSTAIEHLKYKGYKTVDLDVVSNKILTSKQSLKFLQKEFSKSLINGVVDRSLLAEIVFNNKDKLLILENYLHPKVLYELQNIIQNTDDLLFVEVSAPKNVYKDFENIVIFTDAETRMSRLLERGMDREDIVSRMASQKSDDWWKSLGIVVQNNNLSELKIELDKLFENTS
tara:strand:- start:2366 stop:2923 length:558 start_codon:yes stop_codon:yes gene_type:complete